MVKLEGAYLHIISTYCTRVGMRCKDLRVDIMCVKPLCWILLFCFTSFSTSHYTLDKDGSSSLNMWVLVSGDPVAYLLFVIASVGLLFYAGMVFFLVLSVVVSKTFLHRPSGAGELGVGDVLPGMSIIKPLMGVDPLLEHNLESHFKLSYPKFELLFCFHDDKDPAISLVKRLHARYPHVDAKMFIGGKTGVINPMVQNMAPAYDAASYEFVWICSSRVEVSDVIILDMASKIRRPNVSLVHQMPFTTDSSGFGSSVEKVYFGSALSRFYIPLNVFGFNCVTGMSYVFKKSLLDQAHGLEWYGRYLAEDFFLVKALAKRGDIIMSAIPAQQNIGQTTVNGFIDRMVRWLRLRMNMMTAVTVVLEPILDCFPLGLWVAWALHHLFSINPVHFLLTHLVSWILLDYLRLCYVQNGCPAFSKCEFIIAWLVREVLSAYIYFVSLANPQSIKWGKRIFRVKYGGLVELKHEKGYSEL